MYHQLDYNNVVIILSSITSIVTILIACCYKTKCKHLSCFGLNLDRDIESEMKNDVEIGIQGPIPQ